MTKRNDWTMRDALAFASHALEHDCGISTGPGPNWFTIRTLHGDYARRVSFAHDGRVYGTTVAKYNTWQDSRWLDVHDVEAWCRYLAIPTPAEKRT